MTRDRLTGRDPEPKLHMPQNDSEIIAGELLSAQQTVKMIEAPSARPGFNLDTAYAVESILKKYRETDGHRSVGRKVGYANKAMWRALKLETLVWAHMYDDTVHFSDNNAATLSIAHPRSLKIEPEIVFGLKQPLAGQDLGCSRCACCRRLAGHRIRNH